MKKFSLLRKGASWIGALMVMGAMLGVSRSAWGQGNNPPINITNPIPVTLIGNPKFEIFNGSCIDYVPSTSTTTSINSQNYGGLWNVITSNTFTLIFGFNPKNSFQVMDNQGDTINVVGIDGVYLSSNNSIPNATGNNILEPTSTNWVNWGINSKSTYAGYQGANFSTSSSNNNSPNWIAYADTGSGGSKSWTNLFLPQYGAFEFSGGSGNKNMQLALDVLGTMTGTNSLNWAGTGRIVITQYTPIVPESPGALLLLGGAAPLLGALVLFRRRLFSA